MSKSDITQEDVNKLYEAIGHLPLNRAIRLLAYFTGQVITAAELTKEQKLHLALEFDTSLTASVLVGNERPSGAHTTKH